MEREYTIELIEFEGLYFPKFCKIKVEAGNIEDAIERAFAAVGESVDVYDIEWAKEAINDDDYNKMFKTSSNIYKAIYYNYILDNRSSSYRLLRGYCGKRKCFDITMKDEWRAK